MSTETPSSSSKKTDPRNQRVMIAIFVVLIAYTFSEMWSFYTSNQRRVAEGNELLQWMYGPETALIRSSSRRAVNPSGQPLTTVATVSASQQEINFARFEPISEEQIKIWFENIRYDSLAMWLGQLEFNEGVSTISLNVERGNVQGTVSGQVELARAAPAR